MKARNGNIKKTQRSFNEQKIQIRIQKCLRLYRLRSSEKYTRRKYLTYLHMCSSCCPGERLHRPQYVPTAYVVDRQVAMSRSAVTKQQHSPKTFMTSASVHSCLCPTQKSSSYKEQLTAALK